MDPLHGFDAVPLARFEVLRSTNTDEIVAEVSKSLADHSMEVTGPVEQLSARFNRVAFDRCAVDYLELGVPVMTRTSQFEDCYLLFFDLANDSDFETLGSSTAISTATAGVFSPTSFGTVIQGANTKHVHLKLDRQAVERHLQALTGMSARGPIIFDPQVDLTRGCGAMISGLIQLLISRLSADDALLRNVMVITSLEDSLLTALLSLPGHSHAQLFEMPPKAIPPRLVTFTEDYIRANADKPLSVRHLADVSNVSVRSIHHAFRQYRGYTPKALMKSVRLEQARRRLLAAGPGDSVTAIAFDSGYQHLGRFSADYREKYGETPSQTLRRHKPSSTSRGLTETL